MTEKCTGCGNCRIICPVFDQNSTEIYSARGRINLIRGLAEKDLAPSSALKHKIFMCLDCRQCVKYCPADVDYVNIMSSVKQKLRSRSRFFSINDHIVRGMFTATDPVLYFSIVRSLRKFLIKTSGFKFLKKISHFVLNMLKIPVNLPLPERYFFKFNRRHKVKNFLGKRAAVFLGCGGKYVYPETADRFIKILRSSGIEAVIPKEQVCCGNPLIYSGLSKDIDQNNTVNITSFNSLLEISSIVSLCAGASGTLKTLNENNRENGFRFPVRDFAEFMTVNISGMEPEFKDGIIFHSCPKCGNKGLYTDFISELYRNSEYIPSFTGDYCGSTELMNRSVMEVRKTVTDSFCTNNRLSDYKYIACTSFECMEYLNDHFAANGMDIRAIHFIDAVSI